jgi:hypothetical protein
VLRWSSQIASKTEAVPWFHSVKCYLARGSKENFKWRPSWT